MVINKRALFQIFLIGIFLTSCKKEGSNSNNNGFRINIVKGNNQTDTVGRPLKDTLEFRASDNNDTLLSGHVEIFAYDCDGNRQDIAGYIIGRGTITSMYVPYIWTLNSDIGSQKLTAVLFDSKNNPEDSVTVIANALPPSHGWYRSGCSPFNNNIQSFSQLPSGRILAVLRLADYPYYSDDEGMSWHALTTVPSKNNYTKVISTASNEVFLAINAVGILYSSDGGSTWEARNNGLSPGNFWGDLQYTKSGKLFSLTGGGVFKSDDKGLSWHLITYGLSGSSFYDASSTSDSTIYANENSFIQSTDGGETFRPVYAFENAVYFFVDDKDDIYATEYDNSGQQPLGMYVSRDHAQSWNKLYSLPIPNTGFQFGISNMTKHGNLYFFYSTSQNLLVQTQDFNSFYTYTPPIEVDGNGRQSFQYIVTQKGHIIISNEFQGVFYFIP